MDDRDLDRRCAEVVGWTNVKKCWEDPEVWDGVPPDHPTNDSGLPLYSVIRNYSASLDACRELLEWARAKDDGSHILLLRTIENNNPWQWEDREWIILMTTPRQICEAFVECFGGPDEH